MQRSDFFFDLPTDLIAQYPLEFRTNSRLLYINSSEQFQDQHFFDLPNLLSPGDLLVLNDTKVIPARLFGHKVTGAKVEIFIERILMDNKVLALIKASKSPKIGSQLYLENGIGITVLKRINEFFELQFDYADSIYKLLQEIGHVPLPPYIKRSDNQLDDKRYQTVYAQELGAVAAPTAGLHFDEKMLEKIQAMGVNTAFITLHVGAGTFSPIRVTDIKQHTMHSEHIKVSAQVCEQVKATHRCGKRVIAVGTTCVRALETASASGEIQAYEGETRLFITPGYQFNIVNTLITNFHLPESSLLILVSAFIGKKTISSAYEHAIKQKYRFFSYGDAMFINRS
ncbi:MAG: tRNA preQ1(34) S-adenosylmethionine ribosyltransferase-isomerase QueA [Thiomargarita sp.]|nr:tRNA preQ1(34) S-adenosylmethionine ribosyltransferase-isomerase QueA [Thiomargarita sp.]